MRDYSLDTSHPVGKHKAKVFASAIGFSRHDANKLRHMVLQAVLVNEAVVRGENEHGTRYSVDFETEGVQSVVSIRTAWIIDRGETIPRLTSCYVIG